MKPPPFRSFGAYAVLLSLKESAMVADDPKFPIPRPPAKPVVPHYSPTRRALWITAADLDSKIAEEVRSWEYHERQLREGRANVERWREQSRALKMAAEALAGMDKAAIIVEPVYTPEGKDERAPESKRVI